MLRTLRQGASGTDVKDLQVTLQRLGYNPGAADGIFGVRTKQAVLQFQKDNGLSQDGVVGPVTWQRLHPKDPGYQLYTVQSGDTLYKIALSLNISLDSIIVANPGIDSSSLKIGQQIRIPISITNLPLTHSVAGWVPSWLQAQSFRSVQNHPDVFHILSPFWYTMTVTGEIDKLSGAEDSTILSFARNHQMSMIPLISNSFNSELISSVLNDPALRKNHIMNLVNLVQQMNYAGIEINYENLFVKDKEVFVVFLQDLKTALKTLDRRLIVTVHAKTNPFGFWSGAEAHDYVGIGQAADIVRIMGYDYHWQGSGPGTIAPADWVKDVLIYGVSSIASNKIVLGVPTYGLDWPAGLPGKVISYASAIATATKYNAPIIANASLGPHFTYTVGSTVHEVWFTDAASFSVLLDLVKLYSINGICMWYPGVEDPKIYDAIRTKFS